MMRPALIGQPQSLITAAMPLMQPVQQMPMNAPPPLHVPIQQQPPSRKIILSKA